MVTSYFIARIDLDDARYCESCPCLYLTEGLYSDLCQLDKGGRIKQDTRGHYIRPEWCALLEVTGNGDERGE